MAPNELVPVVGESNEEKSHEGRAAEVETALLVFAQEVFELLRLSVFRNVAPVVCFDFEADVLADDLQWFVEALRDERGAEDRVPVDHTLPCAMESISVQLPLQHANQLLEVNSGFGSKLAMKEHPLLHWG